MEYIGFLRNYAKQAKLHFQCRLAYTKVITSI